MLSNLYLIDMKYDDIYIFFGKKHDDNLVFITNLTLDEIHDVIKG